MPKLSKEDQETFKELLENIKTDMISQQSAIGQRASGESADSLIVADTSKGPTLTGSDYWQFLFDGTGRGPGGFPPVNAIQDWIFDKGLSIEGNIDQATFAIGLKIAQHGTDIFLGKPGVKISEIITRHLVDAGGRIARDKVRKVLEPFRKNKAL